MYQVYKIDPKKPQDPQWAKIGQDFGHGPSPGGAAGYLGISRQAVYQAIDRGVLKACKVFYPSGELAAIIVNSKSLDSYKKLRDTTPRADGRKPYQISA